MSTQTQAGVVDGVLLSLVTLGLWQFYSLWRDKGKFEDAYLAERRGRARVEKEMRKISNIRLDTSKGFFVQPIGHISSCYRQCIGTPRQGLLVPSSRATIKLANNVSPEAMEGLQDFSHVWITFKFHLNTNTLKESKAFTSRATFNGKITLPMLKKKLGVFATRSPHRPNPIGVTLAKVVAIDKKKHLIYLQACDLVDGTPVLDVKPYVPAYDTVPAFRIPKWIEDTVFTRNDVRVSPEALAQVNKIKHRLKQYKNEPEEFVKALIETLEAEVRSKFQTSKQMDFTSKGLPVHVLFDEAVVRYHWVAEREFEVVSVGLLSEDAELKEELRVVDREEEEKEWVEGVVEEDDGEQQPSDLRVDNAAAATAERSIYDIDISQFCNAPK